MNECPAIAKGLLQDVIQLFDTNKGGGSLSMFAGGATDSPTAAHVCSVWIKVLKGLGGWEAGMPDVKGGLSTGMTYESHERCHSHASVLMHSPGGNCKGNCHALVCPVEQQEAKDVQKGCTGHSYSYAAERLRRAFSFCSCAMMASLSMRAALRNAISSAGDT